MHIILLITEIAQPQENLRDFGDQYYHKILMDYLLEVGHLRPGKQKKLKNSAPIRDTKRKIWG